MSNIVIFSSGLSEARGIVADLKRALSARGHVCSDWRMLFSNANDPGNIALLPMLCKKIPSFDYAVLVCEGHDLTTITRGPETLVVKTMRDNVLFEIGLSAMALGISKTILVTEPDVHLPEDLVGTNGNLAVKRIFLTSGDVVADQIDSHIQETGEELHQVVIGASFATASGLLTNFICKVLASLKDGLYPDISEEEMKRKSVKALQYIPLQNVHMHIRIVENYNECRKQLDAVKKTFLRRSVLRPDRPYGFHCYFDGNDLHIVDYPTNLATSYDTAKMILMLDADDALDNNAERRFIAKELRLYEASLRTLLNRDTVADIIRTNERNLPEDECVNLIDQIMDVLNNRFTIERVVL